MPYLLKTLIGFAMYCTIILTQNMIVHFQSVIRVAELGSGGFELDPPIQSLYESHNIGTQLFGVHINQLRYFWQHDEPLGWASLETGATRFRAPWLTH